MSFPDYFLFVCGMYDDSGLVKAALYAVYGILLGV